MIYCIPHLHKIIYLHLYNNIDTENFLLTYFCNEIQKNLAERFMETYIKKEMQYRVTFGETPVLGYDILLTAEELSQEMKKTAMDRKRKTGKAGETVETGIFTKTAKFLEKLKIINF